MNSIYVGVIWTLIDKYQKFMTYQLVYNICLKWYEIKWVCNKIK